MKKGQRKHHSGQYRTINGKIFKCWTCDSDIFAQEIAKAKKNGKKHRIIEFQLYIEE